MLFSASYLLILEIYTCPNQNCIIWTEEIILQNPISQNIRNVLKSFIFKCKKPKLKNSDVLGFSIDVLAALVSLNNS